MNRTFTWASLRPVLIAAIDTYWDWADLIPNSFQCLQSFGLRVIKVSETHQCKSEQNWPVTSTDNILNI